MLDHLLPLIYREYEYFDEANKENYGYVIRRRSRPVSSTVSTPVRTPPRPPRRSSSPSSRMHSGVISSRSLKRRRESTGDSEEQGPAKKQHTTETAVKPQERTVIKTSLKRRRDATDDGSEERGTAKKQEQMQSLEKEESAVEKEEQKPAVEEVKDKEQVKTDIVTPVKKPKEPKISAKKKVMKKSSRKTKATDKKMQKEKSAKVSKSATPKRIPLQDITHLYVNEHAHPYEFQQRERFVAGLTTSVAIRFF